MGCGQSQHCTEEDRFKREICRGRAQRAGDQMYNIGVAVGLSYAAVGLALAAVGLALLPVALQFIL